jgi:phage shock protein PspC (stress-responsive transcriptional regulator)
MNKVITINLSGTAYQLEEGGYDVLRTYLDNAAIRLQGNPDRDEIISDIEGALGEKFRALLNSYKTVVTTKEVSDILAAMGPIEADPGAHNAGPTGTTAGGAGPQAEKGPTAGGGAPRRLYRIEEGAMIAGVCNGIAACLNVDPTLIRLAFVFLAIFWGTGVLVYIIMAIVVPAARSPEERAAASGFPETAQEFIRRAKEGYYAAMKGFPDRKVRSEWQRKFRREMRDQADHWRYNWRYHWHVPTHPGMSFALLGFSLLNGIITVVFLCALVSLLATGAVFGVPLPANVPVWTAALLMLIGYGIFSGPLKAARHMCYWGTGQPGTKSGFVFLLDAIVWLAVAASLAWLAFHYLPEVRHALESLPAVAHQAADDIRTWWKGKS